MQTFPKTSCAQIIFHTEHALQGVYIYNFFVVLILINYISVTNICNKI